MKSINYLMIFFISLLFCSIAHSEVYFENKCDHEPFGTCLAQGKIEYVYIYGEIERVTAMEIAHIDGALPPNKPFPKVFINSGGGSIESSIAIGRILRRRKASIIGKDIFFPDIPAKCLSSCTLVAAGATDRNLNNVGFHQSRLYSEVHDHVVDMGPVSKEALKLYLDYFDEMKINSEVKKVILETDYKKIHQFFYDLRLPPYKQKIVTLGFQMHPAKRLKPYSDADSNEDIPIKPSTDVAEMEKGALLGKGNPVIAEKLAKLYFYGNWGVKQNITKGLEWYEKAGDMGSWSAYHNLGVIYEYGREGIPIDLPKSVQYFMKAAKMGYSGSQNNLGWHYYKGEGIEKSIPDAIYWITRAAEQGDPFAYGSLGEIYATGDVFMRNDIEQFKWLSLAVKYEPKGHVLDADQKLLDTLKNTMSQENIRKGDEAVNSWAPLMQTQNFMRDSDD